MHGLNTVIRQSTNRTKWKSFLVSATFLCCLLSFWIAFLRRFEPFLRRDTRFCALRNLRSALRKCFGASTRSLSDVTIKSINPQSIPTILLASKSGLIVGTVLSSRLKVTGGTVRFFCNGYSFYRETVRNKTVNNYFYMTNF